MVKIIAMHLAESVEEVSGCNVLMTFDCRIGDLTFNHLKLVKGTKSEGFYVWAPQVMVAKDVKRNAFTFAEGTRNEIADVARRAYEALTNA